MNIKRGLFRIWLVLFALWTAMILYFDFSGSGNFAGQDIASMPITSAISIAEQIVVIPFIFLIIGSLIVWALSGFLRPSQPQEPKKIFGRNWPLVAGWMVVGFCLAFWSIYSRSPDVSGELLIVRSIGGGTSGALAALVLFAVANRRKKARPQQS